MKALGYPICEKCGDSFTFTVPANPTPPIVLSITHPANGCGDAGKTFSISLNDLSLPVVSLVN